MSEVRAKIEVRGRINLCWMAWSRALRAAHATAEADDRELHARRARFMRTAAHQLKSPLTGIQTLATLIADAEVRGPAVAGVIDKIIRRCREAIEQVEELRTLARTRDAPSERHRVARTPLGDTLTRVWERYADQARSRGQELLWQLADGPLTLDRTKLCQGLTDVPPGKAGQDVASLSAWCVRVDGREPWIGVRAAPAAVPE